MPWIRGEADIHIYNVNGQFVRNLKSYSNQLTVNISDLASGNYHVRIVDGEKIAIQKLAVIR
jgi:hypothetical protein